jgi:hypothetical protein
VRSVTLLPVAATAAFSTGLPLESTVPVKYALPAARTGPVAAAITAIATSVAHPAPNNRGMEKTSRR